MRYPFMSCDHGTPKPDGNSRFYCLKCLVFSPHKYRLCKPRPIEQYYKEHPEAKPAK
jgi:hypothetical protein